MDCLMNDLLWADPVADKDSPLTTGQVFNETRKTSVKFGLPVLQHLLDTEGLKTLVRAHQEQVDGYKFYRWRGEAEDPSCITIFSAPNYCKHKNKGSIMQVTPG